MGSAGLSVSGLSSDVFSLSNLTRLCPGKQEYVSGRCSRRLFLDSTFVGRRLEAAQLSLANAHLSGTFPSDIRRQGQGVVCQGVAAADKKSVRAPREENVAGEFFVDHTCIDCDTCRWMAPEVFSRVGNMSAVHRQPEGEEERLKSLQALLSCPTASIHTAKPAKDILSTHATFPLPIDEATLPGVYHCGYHSSKSFGATSYFIRRREGNILVDSPRYTERLAHRLEALGGVKYMFLSHRDDVADHAQWARRFGCQRVLHEKEVQEGTKDVEMVLYDDGKWDLGSDVELIFTPGHTEGCVCLLWKPGGVLFTGDHLAYGAKLGRLAIHRDFNWWSVPKQVESVKKLIGLNFIWLLPGHGRRYHFKDVEEKDRMLTELVEAEGGMVAA